MAICLRESFFEDSRTIEMPAAKFANLCITLFTAEHVQASPLASLFGQNVLDNTPRACQYLAFELECRLIKQSPDILINRGF